MAYNVNIVDQASVDAFGRSRVSIPTVQFDSKQLFDNRSIFWATSTVTGATTTYSSNRASTTLNATATVGSTAIRQTKRRFNYTAGRSQQIMETFVMGATPAGMIKRVGYFDGYNGIYFENNGGTLNFVIRSNVTGTPINTVIPQSNWNIDKLDGTGSSGITLDTTKVQLLVIDFEWLGTGRVRVGFDINGSIKYAHQFLNANNLTSVYMSSPNLPCRYEITNSSSASASTLEQICTTVISEGNIQPEGQLFSVDRGVTVLSGVNNAALYPLVSIRLDNNKPGATITPNTFNINCTTSNNNYKWALILNPTVAAPDAAVWTPINNSAVQYDVSRTTSNTLTGGTVIASGYGVSGIIVIEDFNSISTLGLDLNNISDQLVLAVQNVAAGTDSFVASLSWREFE
jgi:hypothetical protein